MTDALEKQFDTAMMNIYPRAKAEAKYTASIFFNMVSEKGGLATTRQLINSKEPSEGYTQSQRPSRLDGGSRRRGGSKVVCPVRAPGACQGEGAAQGIPLSADRQDEHREGVRPR